MWQLELAKYVPEFERKAAQITANKERFAQVRAFCIRRGLGVSIMRDFWAQVGDGKLSMMEFRVQVRGIGVGEFHASNGPSSVAVQLLNYTKTGREVTLKEVGPRFELRPYQVRLGTLDQSEAENEWVLRPYMNTARKRQRL